MKNDAATPLYHDQCQALLPSFINGQLSATQQRQVQEHVAQCDLCFAELQQAQQVVDAIRSEPAELEELLSTQRMEANLAQTLHTIDSDAVTAAKPVADNVTWVSRWRRHWGTTPRVAKTVMWAQAACLVVALGFLVALPQQQRGVMLETFSGDDPVLQAAAEHSQVYRVIFHPAATEVDMRTLLNNVDAQIISGPSKAGLYTISTLKPVAQQQLVLQSLRASPWVKLAEPSVLSGKTPQLEAQ
ncbi:MAG: zf-HC2 domain-containing protein [Porticoccaceae bacterium]|nr:zf-HC2 domain-containing protein [Porticoccaceae bacterium]